MKTKFTKSGITISGNIRITQENGDFLDIDLNGARTRTKSGVYCLRNKLNNRIYIGMARNLENRMRRHYNDFKKNTHCNSKLYDDLMAGLDELMVENENDVFDIWDIFEFEVIIYCRPSELTFYENILIKYLNPYYNIHKQKEVKIDNGTCYIEDEDYYQTNF